MVSGNYAGKAFAPCNMTVVDRVGHFAFLKSPYGQVVMSHDDTVEQLVQRFGDKDCWSPEHVSVADCEAANFTCATQHAKAKKEHYADDFRRGSNRPRRKCINEKRVHKYQLARVVERTPRVVTFDNSWENFLGQYGAIFPELYAL